MAQRGFGTAGGFALAGLLLGGLLAAALPAPEAAAQATGEQVQQGAPPQPLGTVTVPAPSASAPADPGAPGPLPAEAVHGSTGPSPADNLQLPGRLERSTHVTRQAGISCVADLICLNTEVRDTYLSIIAEQTAPLISTVFVDINAGDIPGAPERVQARLEGEGRHVIARLGPIPPEYRLGTTLRARLGAVGAVPDRTVYRLPFASGTAREVVWAGNTDNAAQRSFVQWAAEPGTRVLAARGGVVGAVRTQSQDAGLTDLPAGLGNLVAVVHDDGSVGVYGRLDFRGVEVRVGQRVEAGDPLGVTGMTGIGPAPSISFTLVTPVGPGTEVQVWPVRFMTRQGDVAPVEGIEMAH